MTDPACPRDGSQLKQLAHLGVPYHACGTCRGLLLPLQLVASLTALWDEVRTRAANWPRSILGCPLCGRAMHVAHYDGIEIDLCHHCNVIWLDHGEIEKIRPYRAVDMARQQVREESGVQAIEAGSDALGGTDSGVLDWLGEALGALFS